MSNFLSLEQDAFGLDVSDRSIKMARLRPRRGRFSLDCFGEFFLEEGIIEEGNILKEQALVEALRLSLDNMKGKLDTKEVVASLPEEKAFLQVIQMPKMERRDLKRAVYFEAEKYIPIPKENVYLDFEIVKPVVDSLDHLDILISALPKKIVDSYFSVLTQAGLDPVAFEIESQAIARAVVKDNKSEGRLFIIDMGANRSRFIIFAGHTLRFISSSLVCGNTFDKSISQELDVSLEKAARLKTMSALEKRLRIKFKNGEGEKTEQKSATFDALIPSLTDLTEQIQRCVDFYLSHASHEHLSVQEKKMEKIILCGGGAALKGLCPFLEEQLGIPVEKANPWVNITGSPKGSLKMSEEQALKYTVALGLALRGVKKEKPMI